MGVDGQRQVVVDNRGQERDVLGIKEAVPGKNLQLTIDLDLQVVAELAMEGRKGAVVALDPRTGEVLAMVSRPTFDPNKFAVRIKSSDWKEIADNPDHPLLNRAIQAQLAPGSTFKPIMALAGLESGTMDPTWSISLSGRRELLRSIFQVSAEGRARHRSRCTRESRHSCDVYFYNLGNKMGIDTIAKYADMKPGWGTRRGSTCRTRPTALVPSSQWKLRNFRAEVVRGRDDFGVDRAGSADGFAAATGARHRRHRRGRGVARAAPGEGAEPEGEAARRQAEPGQRERSD